MCKCRLGFLHQHNYIFSERGGRGYRGRGEGEEGEEGKEEEGGKEEKGKNK